MLTVILGAGSAGIQLARRLTEDGKDVALIERDPDRARIAANALDCLVVQGDGSEPDILRRASLAKASHFVALTGSDEVNIVTSSVVATEYPNTRRIARVRNPYYGRLLPEKRSFMGVDRFINPDVEAARAFLELAVQGPDLGLVRFRDDGLILRSVTLGHASPLAGRRLKESRLALGRDFLAAALQREGTVEVPSGETLPQAGDSLYILGSPADLEALLGKAPAPAATFRRVVMAGGGAIARLVAEGILETGEAPSLGLARKRAKGHLGRGRKDLVMIDAGAEACKRLSRNLPEALVLNRSPDDEDLFLEEGLEGADLFLALTANQELNLLSAARAKDFGIRRSLALAETNAYMGLVGRLGLDGVVSMKSSVVSSIVEDLRGGVLTTLHSFFDRGLKVLELSVGGASALHGTAIRDLALPRGALVISLARKGRTTLPAGDTVLASGDRLGIFTSMEAIRGVEALFLGADR